MTNLLKFIVPFVLFSIFAVAFINFGNGLAENNNSPQGIFDDPQIQGFVVRINSSIADAQSDANLAESALGNSTITIGGQANILDSVKGVVKIITALPKTVYTFFVGLLFTRLSGDNQVAIIMGAFGSLLIIILIIAFYKLFSTGEGG